MKKGTRIIYYNTKGRILQANRNYAIVLVDGDPKPFVCDYSLLTIDTSPVTQQSSRPEGDSTRKSARTQDSTDRKRHSRRGHGTS